MFSFKKITLETLYLFNGIGITQNMFEIILIVCKTV